MKTCAHCGHPFGPRHNENPARYARRTFCSRSCASLFRNATDEPPPMCHIDGCDQLAKAKRRRLCSRHYEAWRRSRVPHGDVVIDDDPPATRPPVKCVICEAVRILARDGADAQQTAAALHKPLPWIRAHLEECTREKRTA